MNVEEDMPYKVKEEESHIPETEIDVNLTEIDMEENTAGVEEEFSAGVEEEQVVPDEVVTGPDASVEDDVGHFGKNNDNQPSFSASDEMQKVPQANLENPLDMGVGVEAEQSPSGW